MVTPDIFCHSLLLSRPFCEVLVSRPLRKVLDLRSSPKSLGLVSITRLWISIFTEWSIQSSEAGRPLLRRSDHRHSISDLVSNNKHSSFQFKYEPYSSPTNCLYYKRCQQKPSYFIWRKRNYTTLSRQVSHLTILQQELDEQLTNFKTEINDKIKTEKSKHRKLKQKPVSEEQWDHENTAMQTYEILNCSTFDVVICSTWTA